VIALSRSSPPYVVRILMLSLATGLTTTMLAASTASGRAPVEARDLARGAGRLDPLLPDLTPLRAVDVSITRSAGTRQIRFQAGLASIGVAPMEIRPDNRRRCPAGKRHASQIIYRDVDDNARFQRRVDKRFARRSAGCMVFHPTHNHWHFQAASRYAIFEAGRPETTIKHARKMSFCLRDSMRVPPRYGAFDTPLYYRDCGRDTPQGISRGWVDVYASYLTGQSIVIPPRVDRGIFCLSIRVDPLDRLREGDETNNRSVRALHIRGSNVSFAKQRHCA
jgi:hypothetical protein